MRERAGDDYKEGGSGSAEDDQPGGGGAAGERGQGGQ